MAGKKNKKNQQQQAAAAQQQAVSNSTSPREEESTSAPPTPKDAPVPQADQSLEQQLAAAKDEIAELRKQLEAKDREITTLRAAGTTAGAAPLASVASGDTHGEEIMRLQEK